MASIELYPPTNADLNKLIDWENDLDNSEFTDFPVFYSKDQLQEFIHSSHDLLMNNQIRYMIKLKGESIGCIDVFEHDLVNSRAGVGIFIDEKWRKKGFAFEALESLKHIVSSQFQLNQLYATIYSSNEKSLNLFIKAGFEINGKRKKWVRKQEEFEDVHFLQCFI
ncbi:MAG: GNAT family N-acetyltransferase [Crocinitomicaceae bacterium]|nr:GNAT family N-acetyltransferase [Crocinitomicaceae bacterium]|tara:strand:- start:1015 stop:1512 length:498 start_codon:yes stop_codon:yes gene_type:complete